MSDDSAIHDVQYRVRREVYQTLFIRAQELEGIEEYALSSGVRRTAAVFHAANERADRDVRQMSTTTGGDAPTDAP